MRSRRRDPSAPDTPPATGLVSIPLARILADPVVRIGEPHGESVVEQVR
ncbi:MULTISPECIES: hypothetical protein [unclassified Curtobacterium]|jgi:hypothetical protein|nr:MULTISPECIES: hypothetical protein [unclassified Curtobacterium]MCT9619980.1 hypothetical protein [Curtobacterium sp. C2H10]MDR6574819.1 hypothetical protein [Curtobacterium sp. 320]